MAVGGTNSVDGGWSLFDKLAKVGSILRKKPMQPFGGIQVRPQRPAIMGSNHRLTCCLLCKIVVTGDFFQLPPVQKGGGQPTFAFEAQMWNETISASVNLTQVFRQKDQSELACAQVSRRGRY